LLPATPGDPNVICHFCGCQSPHAYICGDCHHQFCLNCVSTETANPPQKIYCPACGGYNVTPNSESETI
jgi:hypothetical protein